MGCYRNIRPGAGPAVPWDGQRLLPAGPSSSCSDALEGPALGTLAAVTPSLLGHGSPAQGVQVGCRY